MEWTLITIVGPILLAIVLAWAMLHNRRSRAAERRTEKATPHPPRTGRPRPESARSG